MTDVGIIIYVLCFSNIVIHLYIVVDCVHKLIKYRHILQIIPIIFSSGMLLATVILLLIF